MVQIAIFDDELGAIVKTKKIIEDFLEKSKVSANVQIFTDEVPLLGYVEATLVDIVFLDIMVDNESKGIDIAKQINQLSNRTEIIFLTGYLHYATDVYDARHIYFILKNDLTKRLPYVFQKLEEIRDAERTNVYCFAQKGYELLLEDNEIMYIERDKRVTKIHCKNQIHEITQKLSQIEKKLCQQSIVRCHNSFMVNFQYALKLKRTSFILKNGEEIPISRAYLSKVRDQFLVWCQVYM